MLAFEYDKQIPSTEQYEIYFFWAGKMVQWIEAFITMPENLSSIPGIHMVGGENHKLSSNFHVHDFFYIGTYKKM